MAKGGSDRSVESVNSQERLEISAASTLFSLTEIVCWSYVNSAHRLKPVSRVGVQLCEGEEVTTVL